MHRLGSGLPGYLILFAPPTFAPQRLSHLSVSNVPGRRLRLRCSAGYQRISPLHPAFPFPLPYSSGVVSSALSGLGPEISHSTRLAAYVPFTPSKSEQRLRPLYYRGCWHRVSRRFLLRYSQLRDASRRSLGSISVPVGLVILSDQLTVGLGGPLPRQLADGARAHPGAGALRPPSAFA